MTKLSDYIQIGLWFSAFYPKTRDFLLSRNGRPMTRYHFSEPNFHKGFSTLLKTFDGVRIDEVSYDHEHDGYMFSSGDTIYTLYPYGSDVPCDVVDISY